MKYFLEILAVIAVLISGPVLADGDAPVSDQDDGSIADNGTGCSGDCDGDRAPDGEVDQDSPVNDQDPVDADPVDGGGDGPDLDLNNGRG